MAKDVKPRERVLKTAARLFFTQGYNATGINQILEEADVAKASLYQHFGSKEELGLAYVKTSREEWFNALNLFLLKKKSAMDKLLGIFDFLEQNLSLTDFRGCRFINLLAEVADHQAMREQIVLHKTNLRNTIRIQVSQILEDDKKDVTNQLADSIYILFEGAIVESKIFRDTWPVKTAKRTAKALLKKE